MNDFEEVRLGREDQVGEPCRKKLWCVTVFQKLLEGEGKPLKTVHFRAKPWKDIKQLPVSMSLIPDGDTRHFPVLGLGESVCAP